MKNMENENKEIKENENSEKSMKIENKKIEASPPLGPNSGYKNNKEWDGKKGIKKIVPDTSILIQGKLSKLIKEGKIKDVKIIIPEMVIDELQAQASRGKEIGFEGFEEIKKIREEGKKAGIVIEFVGRRPTAEEIALARKGRIDALIRDTAAKENGVLYTSDYVQALIAEVSGIQVEFIPQPLREEKLKLEQFFTKETQSVHLKEGIRPLAKRGTPGNVKVVEISKDPISEKELKNIMNQIILKARSQKDSFIEMTNHGALVIQLGDYRISICQPPFSDALEITAVRPTAKVELSDYKMHKELEKKIVDKSIGLLIAGPPGSGKSTFAASIANFLSKQGKIVKTFEQPRDLQVDDEITQYAPLDGDWEKTAEILLLVRPDYTVFDELRRTRDFRVFADMRLAGVGMAGVVHATDPVNAIQRFIGRIELGMISHVIDTVIYIKDGKIEKVYELSMRVKVPSGMIEEDLARPVVEVIDFETKEPQFEIYTFGEENVIMPVSKKQEKSSGVRKMAKEIVYQELRRFDTGAEVDVVSDDRAIVKVKNEVIAAIIGKGGKNIDILEKKLGIHLTIEPREGTLKNELQFQYEEKGSHFYILVHPRLSGKQVDMYFENKLISSPMAGKGGRIKIKKSSDIGRMVLQALASKSLKIVV